MGSTPNQISASRGAAILGLSKWQTPMSVWMDIMGPEFCKGRGLKYEPFDGNVATRWGNAFESSIIAQCEREIGAAIDEREKEYQHKDYDFITCHIDGLYDMRPRTLHEGKTTNNWTLENEWGPLGSNSVPREYQVQVQHQMMCAQAERCIISVLAFPKRQGEFENLGIDPNKKSVPRKWVPILAEMGYFRQYEIKRHPELQARMVEHYVEFHEKCIVGQKAPEPVDYDDIRALCPAVHGNAIADDKITAKVEEYREITGWEATGKARKEELKTAIVKFMVENSNEHTEKRLFLKDADGKRMGSFNGKTFRA